MVRPAAPTPQRVLWTSNVDQVVPRIHTPTVYIYRSNGSSDFFSMDILKEALSKVLVLFYPVAGRRQTNPDGRIEINCNGEGVLVVEAITDYALQDLGNFTPTMDFWQLIPKHSYSQEISSSTPTLLVQVNSLRILSVWAFCSMIFLFGCNTI